MMSDVSLVILERCAIKIVCREVCHSFQRIASVNEKPIAPNKSKCWPDFRGRQNSLKRAEFSNSTSDGTKSARITVHAYHYQRCFKGQRRILQDILRH